jgi:hypothetical protein
MDREFALVLYRAFSMITAYLAKRFGFGGHSVRSGAPGDEHAGDS